MATEGGVFLDIFTRLNLASVERVLSDVKKAMRDGGAKAGQDFDEGLAAGLDGAKAGFKELTFASDAAYRQMKAGLADLAVAEAKVNRERLASFEGATRGMIAAQHELDAAIANTQKLIEASRSADAAVIAGRGRDRSAPDRGGIIPDRARRVGRTIGAGAALATGGVLIEGGRIAADTGRNMQQVRAFHPNESQAYINQQTQSIYQMATQVPYAPRELSKVYQDIENHGYTGQAALDVLKTSAETAASTGADLKDTTDGLMTSVKDFGVQAQLQSSNLDDYKKGLADLNQMAGQLVTTFGNLKGVNPDEFFKSLGTIEPIARQYLTGMPGPQASANVNASLAVLAQLGIGPEQGSHNVARVMSALGAISPGGKMYTALNQLGLNPQTVMATENTQGPFAALQMINQAIGARTDKNTGLVNVGWRFNSQEVQGLVDQGMAGLSPEGQAFVAAHPEISEGLSTFKTKKALLDAGVSGNDAQDILEIGRWQAMLHGPNKFTKQGEPTNITPGQMFQIMFGTGDIARTASALSANAGEGQQMVQQFTQAGSGALTGAFKQMMSTIPMEWKQLGSSLQGLAGELGTHVIPAATKFVADLNGAADWLSRNKVALHALETAVGTLAAAWGASKLINIFKDLQPAVNLLTTGASKFGGLLSDRLPTQVAPVGTKAATLATAEGTAATEIETAGGEIATAGTAAKGLQTAEEAGAAGISGAAGNFASKLAMFAGAAGVGLAADQDLRQYFTAHPMDKNPANQKLLNDPNTKQLREAFGTNPGQHWARGGVVGFKGGGLTNPYSQPLMSVPDKGVDTVLGMLPNGSPVGLRGGEGILTPEAVAAIGGKQGVDALNANPWADPFKVGTTFYSSFAKGVAKYSPWGKYFEATSQSLDSLEQAHEDAEKANGAGDFGKLMRAIGKAELYGDGADAFSLYGSGHRHRYGSNAIGKGNPNVMAAIGGAYWQSGFPANQFGDLKWIISHESGFNPNATNPKSGAYGLGQFLGHQGDKYGAMGAYSGDPSQETNAMLAYIRDRYGDPSHAKAFWQAHGWYSKGGVVGFAGGGMVPTPTQPGATAAQAVPNIATQAQARGIAPKDTPGYVRGASKPGASVKSAQPKVPQPPHPQGDKGKQAQTLTPEGTKPGQYASPGDDRKLHGSSSRQPGLNNTSKGFGVGGGLIGAAESAATTAANVFAPGSGQAANMAFALANRAVGYAGQLVGIGIEGLMETFLPNNSPLADPTNNILGKVALGIAGAHPSPKNSAGNTAMKMKPKQNLDAGEMSGKQLPGIHISGDIHNHGQQDWTGLQKAMVGASFGLPTGNSS